MPSANFARSYEKKSKNNNTMGFALKGPESYE